MAEAFKGTCQKATVVMETLATSECSEEVEDEDEDEVERDDEEEAAAVCTKILTDDACVMSKLRPRPHCRQAVPKTADTASPSKKYFTNDFVCISPQRLATTPIR